MSTGPTNSDGRDGNFSHVVENWSHMGPPLRPWPSDTLVLQRAVESAAPPGRVVVLGLTHETIGWGWPAGTELIALDNSRAMLAALWPVPGAPARSHAVLSEWLHMPLADAVAGLVCADGSHSLMSYPLGYRALATEVSRVLRPGGRFFARAFLRPDTPEPTERIAADLLAGRIGSVDVLKLRLFAAVHGQSGSGTCLGDVWNVWKTLPPLPPSLAGRPGWSAGALRSMESHRGLSVRLYLPTLGEIRQAHGAHFDEIACHQGAYEIAGQCPTLVWQRKP